MKTLDGRYVFLSASFPSGKRGEQVQPFDAPAIADAVTAIVRVVLANKGKLLFGGHPTITPLVLMIGAELRVKNAVAIFQSEWFSNQITEETWMLGELEVGKIHWTPRCKTLDESLAAMRRQMLKECNPIGAVFIGGMSGIWEEHELVRRDLPGVPRIPLVGPGGAAAQLPRDEENVPQKLRGQLHSHHYPFVASLIVDELAKSTQNEDQMYAEGLELPPPLKEGNVL